MRTDKIVEEIGKYNPTAPIRERAKIKTNPQLKKAQSLRTVIHLRGRTDILPKRMTHSGFFPFP